jgi:hypothetical protein
MAGGKLFAKKGSWNVKSFRMLAFDEREMLAGEVIFTRQVWRPSLRRHTSMCGAPRAGAT